MQKEDKLEYKENNGSNYSPHAISGLNSCQSNVLNASWEEDGDIFNREQYADRLNYLVKNTKVPYVIALSSAWGTGKTYFLNAWKNKHGYKEGDTDKTPCVYFSAWENEEDDPRIAIVSAIKVTLQKSNLLEVKEAESLVKKTVKSFTKPSILGKLGSRLFKEYLNKKTDNEIDDVFAEVFSEQAESLLDRYAERSENKVDFIKELESIVDKVKDKTNSPILVMIDELDRCKPDYVISLLESIKHFFSINGLVFVLAIDKNQLLSVVEHTFGLKDEYSQIYLEKFIDLFFELPEADLMAYAKELLCKYFSDIPTEFIKRNLPNEFSVINPKQEINYGILLERVHGQSSAQVENLIDQDYTNQLFNDIQLHQQVLLRLIYDSQEHFSSIRNLEKKFFKFITLYNAYKPSFGLCMILLKNVMTVDKKSNFSDFLLIGKEIYLDKAFQEHDISSKEHREIDATQRLELVRKLSVYNAEMLVKGFPIIPKYELICLSLEILLLNRIKFIPSYLSSESVATVEEAFKIFCGVNNYIGRELLALKSSSRVIIKNVFEESIIQEIQSKLNSMLDFGNLISASDTLDG